MKFPLMRDNIPREDLNIVINYLMQDNPKLTNGEKVREFEEAWSNWLDVKYSVFVNSGASANLLTMAVLKIYYPEGGEVIVPPLTWSSDISSVIQNGFTPIFVDINPQTLGMDTKQILAKIGVNTRAVFLTHAQGFNGLSDELLHELGRRNIPLIEDVCESHGATHGNKKLGSVGWISNFSFYYAHHMSTIEGGMVCTNDEKVYQIVRMLRSHGMLRESSNKILKNKIIQEYSELNPEFIFMYPAYNLRNTEIGGILGLAQLSRLDQNIKKRTSNLKYFLSKIDKSIFRTDFKLEGSSNYAFNLILKEKDDDLVNLLISRMKEAEIEYRRGSAGGGNQLRQPYLKSIVPDNFFMKFPETEHIHFYGFYIGNFPSLNNPDIDEICKVLNVKN